ncbi:MAG: hypothetical protein Q9181_001978 [Wetmoreana brouardii]
MSPPLSPLKSRSVNTSSPTKPSSTASKPIITEDEKPKSMEYHRQVLQSKLNDEGENHKYISPSDMIMSPATKKLEALKGKRFGKAKPQSLFANTTTKNHNGSLDSGVGKKLGDGEEVEQ